MSYELHPEAPPEGVKLAERFRGRDMAPFYENLKVRGSELGIVFNPHTLLSNSRKALLASEYARDMGRYGAFHENMFSAYLTKSQDIGLDVVIAAVAQESGLDPDETLAAVGDGRYDSRLADAIRAGRQLGLTGIPLFVVNDKYKITGTQPLEIFRDLLGKIK